MGQKINPKLFRLGTFNNDDWKLRYIENKSSESSSLFFKALQIKEYIKRILRFHGLRLHDYNVDISSTSLHIKITYRVTPYSIFFMDKPEQISKTLPNKKLLLLQRNLVAVNLLFLLKQNKKNICNNNTLNNLRINFVIDNTFIVKLTKLLISGIQKKITLLKLLLYLVKKKILIKKHVLTLLLKKYSPIFVKNRLECSFTQYYFLKIKKRLKKNKRSFIFLLRLFFKKLKKTKIGKKTVIRIIDFTKIVTGKICKKILLLLKSGITTKKFFFLLLILNYNSKYFLYGRKKLKKTKKNYKSSYKKNYKSSYKKNYKSRYSSYSSQKKKAKNSRGKKKTSRFKKRFLIYFLQKKHKNKRKKFNVKKKYYNFTGYYSYKKNKSRSTKYFCKNVFPLKKKLVGKSKSKHLLSTYLYWQKKTLNHQNNKTKKIYSFTERIMNNLKCISNKETYSVFLTFQHCSLLEINASVTLKKALRETVKKKIFELNRYKNNVFFEDSIIAVLITLTKNSSAQFLADHISSKLSSLVKKQRFFLNFIKKIFKLFISVNFSKIKGVKITFRGRIDKKSRKQISRVIVGDIGLQRLKSCISHAKSTSITSDGTVGTEVWVNYK